MDVATFSLEILVERAGGVVPRAAFLAAGHSPRALASAVLDGRLIRVRRAWYAAPDADPDRITAVMLGGKLGAFSAAASYGLWRGLDADLHVSWGAHGNIAKPGRLLTGIPSLQSIVPHWQLDGFAPAREPWRESVQQSVAQVLPFASDLDAIALCDSALNQKMLTPRELREIFARAPARLRSLEPEVHASADSGLESRVRLWSTRAGHPTRTQVVLGGHPVDVLIGKSLIVEADGRTYHSDEERFESDRGKTGRLQLHGFTVYRPSYRMVMYNWPEVEATMASLIGQGRSQNIVSWI